MPKYDFRCDTCGSEFSETLPMGTTNVPSCASCHKPDNVRKIIRAPMVHFKGSGFYKTDSSMKKDSKATKESRESKEMKTEAAPLEAKPVDSKSAEKQSETKK